MEDKIKQYVIDGGKLFIVTLIDIIRDGGTIIIKTSNEKINYYIDKTNHTIHSEYPTKEDNLITDKNHLHYIKTRIEDYIEKSKSILDRNINILKLIKL